MKIEDATVPDAEQILELQKLAYISEWEIYSDYNIPPLIQTQGEIIKEFDDQLFLKGTINDTIIGSVRAYVKNGSCFIGRLIVHPNYQNKGIGTKLMCEIEKRFDNTNRFELFTGYKSEQNIRFYENLGYNIIRTEQISDNFKFVYLEKKSLNTVKN